MKLKEGDYAWWVHFGRELFGRERCHKLPFNYYRQLYKKGHVVKRDQLNANPLIEIGIKIQALDSQILINLFT